MCSWHQSILVDLTGNHQFKVEGIMRFMNAWRSASLLPFGLCAILATACTDDPTGYKDNSTSTRAALTALTPSQITIVSGNNQTYVIGKPLAQELVVRALDANGAGLSGVPFAWQVTLGGGSVVDLAERTDANGYARAQWTLGTTLGMQNVRAVSGSLAAVFKATALKSGAAVIVKLGGDRQSGIVGSKLPDSLTVQVRDATGKGIAGVSVSWSTSSTTGTVSPTMKVTNAEGIARTAWTVKAAGELTARASVGSLATADAMFSATGSLTPGVANVVITPTSVTLSAIGAQQALVAKAYDANSVVLPGVAMTWSSTNSAVATVDSTGRVTAKAVGTAQVIARATCCNKADTASVAVTQPIASLAVSPKTATLQVGGKVTLTATARDAGGNVIANAPVSWSTSNPAVATVAQGVVTAVAAGTATIRATSGSFADSAVITVSTSSTVGPVASVTISPASGIITVGSTQQFSATAKDANGNVVPGQTFQWISSNTTVASVSTTGLVTAKVAGSTTITASTAGKVGSAAVTVGAPTTIGPVVSVVVSPSSGNITVGFTQQFSATAKDANGNVVPGQTFQWSSTNPTVASVSTAGLVSAKAVGSATITASTAGKSGSAAVTVASNSVSLPTGLTTVIDSRGDDKYYGRPPAPIPGNAYIVGDINFGAGWTATPTNSTTPGVWIVNDAASPFGKAIQKNYPIGATQGFNGQVTAGFGPWKAFHVRMTLMYSPNWQLMADKWFYFGSDGARAIFYFGISPQGTLQFHAQNTGPGIVTGPDGAAVYRSQTPISFGVYHTLEVYAAAQTAPGTNDANFWVYLDGKPVTQWQFLKGTDPRNGSVRNLTNLNLFGVGTTNLERMTYGGFQEFVYWGGTGTKTQNDWVRQAEFLVQGK
jgi:uncharacterized protein YjdB